MRRSRAAATSRAFLNFLETREKDAARGVGLLASAFAKLVGEIE
jgi:hypothetical protein